MPSPTTHFGWTQPTVGGSTGAWGTILNTMHDQIDLHLRANAGKVGEQPIIPAGLGYGDSWVPVQTVAPIVPYVANLAPGGGAQFILPLLRLVPGQRITAFTSRGHVTGAGACVIKLCWMDTAGLRTEVSAGHSLAGSDSDATTVGLTHDVLSNVSYFIEATPSGGAGSVILRNVRLVVSYSP